jgi:hypothetical protein
MVIPTTSERVSVLPFALTDKNKSITGYKEKGWSDQTIYEIECFEPGCQSEINIHKSIHDVDLYHCNYCPSPQKVYICIS